MMGESNKKKSLNKNLLMSAIKVFSTLLFPLITYPYVTKVLGAGGVGEYHFSNSLVNYYGLIAGLGISTYAIREGVRFREKKEELTKLTNEIFGLNIISTVIAYALLGLSFAVFPSFRHHTVGILVCSTGIIFTTIGVSWIFNIYEDFTYITIRSLVFQVISLLLLVLFVKTPDDVYKYIAITVFSGVGANIFNLFYSKRYLSLCPTINKNMIYHMKPVLIIFSLTLSTMIYVNSDTTMLGLFWGNEQVGYYSVACKMYNCIKSIINGLVPVFMARLARDFCKNKKNYDRTFQYAFDFLSTLTIPLAVGGLIYSQEIILLLSSPEYLSAQTGMKILLFSLIFATLGNLISSGGLLLDGKENVMFWATGLGAILNIVLNLFMIPLFKVTGAAITTLITELFIFIVLYYQFKRSISTKINVSHLMKCGLAATPFGLVKWVSLSLGLEEVGQQMAFIPVCVFIYFLTLILLRDRFVLDLMGTVRKRLQRGRYK